MRPHPRNGARSRSLVLFLRRVRWRCTKAARCVIIGLMGISVTVHNLTEVTIDDWTCFLEEHERDAAASILREVLRNPYESKVRLIAKVNGDPAARLRLIIEAPVLRFTEPFFAASAERATREQAVQALLGHIFQIARSEPGITVLETRPAEDVQEYEMWMDALGRTQFVEMQRAHSYHLRMADSPAARRMYETPSVAPAQYSDSRLVGLLDEIMRNSENRGYALMGYDSERYLRRLDALRGDFPLLVSSRDGDVTGMVAAGLRYESVYAGLTAWVYEIGARRRSRGNGVGGALLDAAMQRLSSTQAGDVLAMIDDQNAASIGLFTSRGFERQPTAFMIHRRSL